MKDITNRIRNKRGGATVYVIIALLIVLAVAGMFVKMNWRRFKAEAGFAFTMVAIVVVILFVVILIISRSIKKAKIERDQKKLAKERAKHEEEVARLEAENAKLEAEVDALEDRLEDKDKA